MKGGGRRREPVGQSDTPAAFAQVDKTLSEKSSLSSVLKEFLEFLEQQVHLLMCSSVLV